MEESEKIKIKTNLVKVLILILFSRNGVSINSEKKIDKAKIKIIWIGIVHQ